MPVSERQKRYEKSRRGRQVGRDATRRYNARRLGYALPPSELDWPRPKDGRCQLCRRRKPLHFDHDHKTGKFRGWLCNFCNRVLMGRIDKIGLPNILRYISHARKIGK